jgi:hypothetical protein
LAFEVGFIREKGKATAREVQWSPEAGSAEKNVFKTFFLKDYFT